MKSRFFALLLAGVLLVCFTACSFGGVQSIGSVDAEEESSPKIPKAVLNLSEEDDILLNGELKDNVYINRYFGLKFTAPEGMTLSRLNDDVTETTEIIPLRQAFENGYDGIIFTTELGATENVFIMITAVDDEKADMNEEELIKANIQETNELVTAFGLEGGSRFGTAVVAGEEHPVQISDSDPEAIDVYFFILKDGFEYYLSISGSDEGQIEYLLSFFEKI